MVKEKYSIKNVIKNFISSHKWIVVAYMFLMIAFPQYSSATSFLW